MSGLCSSEFKSFAYLYNEDQFIAALAKDVNITRTLPKNIKEARKKKAVPLYSVPSSASPYFYLHQVLPMLRKHSVVELVVSDGGCLQVMGGSRSYCCISIISFTLELLCTHFQFISIGLKIMMIYIRMIQIMCISCVWKLQMMFATKGKMKTTSLLSLTRVSCVHPDPPNPFFYWGDGVLYRVLIFWKYWKVLLVC